MDIKSLFPAFGCQSQGDIPTTSRQGEESKSVVTVSDHSWLNIGPKLSNRPGKVVNTLQGIQRNQVAALVEIR